MVRTGRWMQEGSRKDRKGFTEGFNQAIQDSKFRSEEWIKRERLG